MCCLEFQNKFVSNFKMYLLNHATSRVDPCWPVKCGRDLVRRQEILPKLLQEEEEGEASGALADWLGRPDGSQLNGPDGRGSTGGWRVLLNHLVTFPAPDRPHYRRETFEGPAGQERPIVQPVQLIGATRLTTACPQSQRLGK